MTTTAETTAWERIQVLRPCRNLLPPLPDQTNRQKHVDRNFCRRARGNSDFYESHSVENRQCFSFDRVQVSVGNNCARQVVGVNRKLLRKLHPICLFSDHELSNLSLEPVM
jgi:hypothetical protein